MITANEAIELSESNRKTNLIYFEKSYTYKLQEIDFSIRKMCDEGGNSIMVEMNDVQVINDDRTKIIEALMENGYKVKFFYGYISSSMCVYWGEGLI